jgi:uncharacterized membrane protein
MLIRLYRLGDDSLWYDEILSHQRATVGLGDAYSLIREGTHPPGYSQIVLRPWLAIGDGEFMQRLPSAAFGVVTVMVTAAVGIRLAGRWGGLAAAALLTFMPIHVYYSREGRMYALLALVITAWVAALIRARERDTWPNWVAYWVLGASTLYIHYYAGFTVLSVVAITAVHELRAGWTGRSRRWLIATVGIGVAFLPWLPTFGYQLGNTQLKHLESLVPGFIALLPVLFFTGFAGHSAFETIAVITALGLLFGLRIWISRTDSDQKSGTEFANSVIVGAVVGTLVLSVILSLIRPLFFVRYFVGIVPLFAVIVGSALTRIRVGAVAAFVVLLIIGVVHTIPTVTDTWRPPLAQATEHIEAEGSEGVAVVSVGIGRYQGTLDLKHYLDPAIDVVDIIDNPAESRVVDALLRFDEATETVWVIHYEPMDMLEMPEGFVSTFAERFDYRILQSEDLSIWIERLERVAE